MQTKTQKRWKASSSLSSHNTGERTGQETTQQHLRNTFALFCRATALGLLTFLVSCQRPPTSTQATYFVLGTEVTISVDGLNKSSASATLASAQQILQQIHKDWHAWEPGMLTQLNQAIEIGQCRPIDDPLRKVLGQAQQAEEVSGGLFNAATGGLVRAWGFHTSTFPLTTPPPSNASVQRLLDAEPSMSQVDLKAECVSADNPGVRIDLGGIGKGAAVDQVIELLKNAGANRGLVNAGGDLRGFSALPAPWRIAVRNPSSPTPFAVLELEGDESVFTSGGYARFGETQGKRYSHIIDPRTGQPAAGALSVTVIANNGALADAAATALVISGAEGAASIFRSMELTHVLLIEHNGCVSMDPGLALRLEYHVEPPDCIILLSP